MPGTNTKPALLLAEAERALSGTQIGALEGRYLPVVCTTCGNTLAKASAALYLAHRTKAE